MNLRISSGLKVFGTFSQNFAEQPSISVCSTFELDRLSKPCLSFPSCRYARFTAARRLSRDFAFRATRFRPSARMLASRRCGLKASSSSLSVAERCERE